MSRLRLQASPCSRERIDGAMLFLEKDKHRARSVAAKALKEYEAREADKGVHFDGEEAQKLRDLAEYLMRGYVGPHAKTIELIRRKVGR